VPDWNADDPSDKFIRGFGRMALRRKGGHRELRGERVFADFDQVARFQGPIEYRQLGWAQSIRIEPWYRRLYFDGSIAGRFEFGFLADDLAEAALFEGGVPNGYDIAALTGAITAVPIKVSGLDLLAETAPLEDIGNALGAAYVAATTRRAELKRYPMAETFGTHVAVGNPMVAIRLSGDRPAIVGHESRRIYVPDCGTAHVAVCKSARRDIQVLVQESRFGTFDERPAERVIRVIFSHLNAFIFAASCYKGAFDMKGTGTDRKRLADLLANTMRRLGKFRPDELEDPVDRQFAESVRAFSEGHAGRLDSLLIQLEGLIVETQRPSTLARIADKGGRLVKWVAEIAVKEAVDKMIKPDG